MTDTIETVDVLAFGIEADHPRNSDLLIQGVENCRLRSSIKPTKQIMDEEDGEPVERPVNAWMVDGFPNRLSGMQLHVDPEKLTWKIVDPLEGNERVLAQIKKAVDRNTGYSTIDKLKGMPERSGTLGKDEMKTLVREMVGIINSGEAKVIGMKPDMDDVDNLPGRYLLNISNREQWKQPRYEDELSDWERNLNRMGD